jgi:hypothetical protein
VVLCLLQNLCHLAYVVTETNEICLKHYKFVKLIHSECRLLFSVVSLFIATWIIYMKLKLLHRVLKLMPYRPLNIPTISLKQPAEKCNFKVEIYVTVYLLVYMHICCKQLCKSLP